MLQSQQVTTFPAAHMRYRSVRVSPRHFQAPHSCVCLSDFSVRILFPGWFGNTLDTQTSSSTFFLNQSAKNVTRNQAAPPSRVSSPQDDPGNCFNQLQLRWKILHTHRDTDLYWFLEDDPESWFKNSVIITEWLFLLLTELNISTSPGVKWMVHSLRRGGASTVLLVCRSVIMVWDWWKSLVSALLYIDVSVWSSSEALLLRSPSFTLQFSWSVSPSTSTVNCCELAYRPERHFERLFGSVARVWWLAWSLSWDNFASSVSTIDAAICSAYQSRFKVIHGLINLFVV